ncbi:MAG TPA: orotate phosphoribosyltransferase [Clostridiales bacterium]|nr:orotate phosphoribosyltransferase [Clostridiales bacterium]
MEQNEIYEIFKKSGALLEGHFLLTSGRHSNRYMQCAQVLKYPEYTEKLCKVIADAYRDSGVELVVGPAMGGILVAYEVAKQLGVPNIFAERENGKMVLRRNFSIEKGQKVLVVEDVVTTGGSVLEVINIVKEAGGDLVGAGVLVDRSNGTVDLGVQLVPVLSMEVVSYDAAECPMCKNGEGEPYKPGSRNLK